MLKRTGWSMGGSHKGFYALEKDQIQPVQLGPSA